MNRSELIQLGAPDPGPRRTYSVKIEAAGSDEDCGWSDSVTVCLLEKQMVPEYKFFKKKMVERWVQLDTAYKSLSDVSNSRQVETTIVRMCSALVDAARERERHREVISDAVKKYST